MSTRLAACLLMLGWLLTGPVMAGPVKVSQLQGQTMGTSWKLQWFASNGLDARHIRHGVQAQLDRVDQQMSTWKPDSDLNRFNRAPPNTWQVLPNEFYQVLQHALTLARQSDGAYDPTVGALVTLWGFGPVPRGHQAPSRAAIAKALKHVGWQRIKLDPTRHAAWQPGGVTLDLSSIAKGYGVDQVARWLIDQGIDNFLIEVGGELRTHGNKPGEVPWRVAVERPGAAASEVTARSQVGHVLALNNQAVATSGDYRHYFEDDGRTYSHHIDPRTGWPVPYQVASVTVVADTCMQADPIGTTLSVMGPQAGMAWARAHGLAVLMLVHGPHGLEQRMTPAFARLLPP